MGRCCLELLGAAWHRLTSPPCIIGIITAPRPAEAYRRARQPRSARQRLARTHLRSPGTVGCAAAAQCRALGRKGAARYVHTWLSLDAILVLLQHALPTSTSLPQVAARMNAAAYRVEDDEDDEPVGSHSVQYTYVATPAGNGSAIAATTDAAVSASSTVAKRLAAPDEQDADIVYKEYQGESGAVRGLCHLLRPGRRVSLQRLWYFGDFETPNLTLVTTARPQSTGTACLNYQVTFPLTFPSKLKKERKKRGSLLR